MKIVHAAFLAADVIKWINGIAIGWVAVGWWSLLAQSRSWDEILERWGLPTLLLLGGSYLAVLFLKQLFGLADRLLGKVVDVGIETWKRAVESFIKWMESDAEARQKTAEVMQVATERDGQVVELLRSVQIKLDRIEDRQERGSHDGEGGPRH